MKTIIICCVNKYFRKVSLLNFFFFFYWWPLIMDDLSSVTWMERERLAAQSFFVSGSLLSKLTEFILASSLIRFYPKPADLQNSCFHFPNAICIDLFRIKANGHLPSYYNHFLFMLTPYVKWLHALSGDSSMRKIELSFLLLICCEFYATQSSIIMGLKLHRRLLVINKPMTN